MSNEALTKNEIQDKIAELESKRKELDGELLSTQKQLVENQEFQEQQRLKELATVEPEFERMYKELLTHNWQVIPNFLNEAFQKVSELCNQYDVLHKKNLELDSKFKSLKKRYGELKGENFAKIHSKLIHETETVELDKELEHIMILLTSDLKLFRAGMPTRFLNPIYSRARKDF